jgi:imidazolonepropionase
MVVWDLPHENAIVQPWGAPKTWVVLRNGLRIGGAAD